MQGPVYGLSTKESDLDFKLSPFFNYDDIFGTVVNRFVTQAIAGIPLTIYGKGEQIRGYLNIKDTLQCIELAIENPPILGELRVLNQFTEKFSVNEIAKIVKNSGAELGIDVKIEAINNPRQEKEEHYYNPKHSGLADLGLKPHLLSNEVIKGMMNMIMPFKKEIDIKKVMPRVNWKN